MSTTRNRTTPAGVLLKLLLVAAACGVAFASLASLATGRASAQAPAEDKLAYYDLNGNLFVMNADGTGATPLGPGRSPAWSPDAQRLVFAHSPDGPETTLIFSVKADGTERARLSDGYQDFSPSYSPDGAKIVFVSQRVDPEFPPGDDLGHTYRLFTMNADGSEERKLFSSGLRSERVPVYSPDGTRIAFVGETVSSTGTSEFNVYVVGADGTDLRRVTNYEGFQLDPGDPLAFSPDGQRIVYTHRRDLYSVAADGAGQPVRLTDTTFRDESGPTFSPEGTKIAFSANDFNDDAADGIYLMSDSGQDLVFTGINGRDPRWMPRPVAEPTPTPTPTPTPAADLSVRLTASAHPEPAVGRDLTYTLLVSNHGPDSAANVVLNFKRPASATFVSAQATQGTCAPSNADPETTQCLLGGLAAGQTATAYVLTRPTAPGEITAHSSVVSGVDDPEQGNNTQPLTVTVAAACVPEVTGEVAATVIRNGNQSRKQLDHTIVVQNTSGRRLHGLVHFAFEGLHESVSGDKQTFLRETRCSPPVGMRYTSIGVGQNELVWEPGQTITMKVEFFNPDRVPVGYRLRVYTGPGYP